MGLALKMSSLGAGIEIATPITHRSNLRAGFNAFALNKSFTNDRVAYSGRLTLRSLQVTYDWFPRGGSFHISPGLIYNGNWVKAGASMPLAQPQSNFASQVTGSGKIEFYKVAPMFLVGWGNLIPRANRRLSFPFEFGVIYHGAPRASLKANGVLCDPSGANCLDAASDPAVQSGIQAEQSTLTRAVSPYRFYPVVSAGIGCSF
jgi:hypothetical protein